MVPTLAPHWALPVMHCMADRKGCARPCCRQPAGPATLAAATGASPLTPFNSASWVTGENNVSCQHGADLHHPALRAVCVCVWGGAIAHGQRACSGGPRPGVKTNLRVL